MRRISRFQTRRSILSIRGECCTSARTLRGPCAKCFACSGRVAWPAGRPRRSLADVYAHHLESPGTKAYSLAEARSMFSEFSQVDIRTVLNFGDLLEGAAGQRHRGP